MTELVEPTEPGSVWEKVQLHLTSTFLLDLLAAEYLRETNTSSFICHIWFFFFGCLEKVFEVERNKNKEGNRRGATTNQFPQKEIGMMSFFSLTSDLLVRTTLTLVSSFAITSCFQTFNFQGFNIVILNLSCHLHSCMRYVSFSKNRLSQVEIIVFQ